MEYSLEPIELNKEIILSKISEEEILSFYGVPLQKGLFCSKLRSDKKPTVSVFRNKKGRIMVHDFGDGSYYDCFAYVQALFQVSYYSALRIIANDFGIITKQKLVKHKPKLEYNGEKVEERSDAEINVEIRELDEKDLAWWGKYGITTETLKKFKVFACNTVWLNENITYINNDKQKAYGYFGGIRDKRELWRIYFPGRKSKKFMSNWKKDLIQGAHMLPKSGEYIVITKSQKDLMVLYEYGIPAIAPCSENEFLTEAQYKRIKLRFKHIICNYDNDIPGISSMCKLKKKYPELEFAYLPIHGGDKDISDYRARHGHKKTQELISKSKAYYEEKWRKEDEEREAEELNELLGC